MKILDLFRKRQRKVKECDTREEYYAEIRRMQNEELRSSKYAIIKRALENNYWNRSNIELEEELLKIVGTYGLEDKLINKSEEYKTSTRLKRYADLKKFYDKLTVDEINSNIFLKTGFLFLKTVELECKEIIEKANAKNESKTDEKFFKIKHPISEEFKTYLPDYISTQRAIPYYNPSIYEFEYIDLLDKEHKHVYEDYNVFVRRITKLAEDIYFLELNYQLATKNNDLTCYYFQIYHPGVDDHLEAGFFPKKEKEETSKDESTVKEEFVRTTVNNFKALLELGVIDKAVLEDEEELPRTMPKLYVKTKRKNNEGVQNV